MTPQSQIAEPKRNRGSARLSDTRLDAVLILARRLGQSPDLWIHLTEGLTAGAVVDMAQRAAAVLPAQPKPEHAEKEAPAALDIADLPFVRDPTEAETAAGHKGRVFWSATEGGGYFVGRMRGKAYAEAALRFMASGSAESYLLPWVVRDMTANGRDLGAVGMGFLSHFGAMASAAQHILDAHCKGDKRAAPEKGEA